MAVEIRDRKNLTLSKFSLLERMEKLLDNQRRDLEADDLVRLARVCSEVDEIIGELRKIDLQLLDTETCDGIFQDDFDRDVGEVALMIAELSQRNKAAIGELLERLSGRQAEIKNELEETVALRQIGAYRPYAVTRPVYLDRHN